MPAAPLDDEDDAFDDDEGELVERGTLRVDPKAAAEKLSEFQLSAPQAFLVPWLRAAVASGAREVRAGVVDGALTFSFDGADPGPAVLADLTSAFLAGDGGPVASHLAFGALALQRLAPDLVRASREDGRTVVRVRWAGGGAAAAALKRLRAAYGMTGTVLTVDGEAVPDPSRRGAPVREWSGKRSRTAIFEDAAARGNGEVHLYALGAWVETIPFDLGGHFEAYSSNDAFTLSLSQASVVTDKRYEKLIKRLGRARRRLARREATPASKARAGVVIAAWITAGLGAAWAAVWVGARLLAGF